MKHASAVSVLDGIADVGETPQQPPQLQRASAGILRVRPGGMEVIDRLLEALSLDEPHGVVGPAAVVGPQPVYRHDAGVFKPAGDLGLEHEAGAAEQIVGVRVEDLLEGNLAVQLRVQGHEDGAQATLGVRPQDAEPLSVGGGRADGIAGGEVGILVVDRGGVGCGSPAEVTECRLDHRRVDPGQFQADTIQLQGGQAALDRAALALDMLPDQAVDQGTLLDVEAATIGEQVGDGPGPVTTPDPEGGEELVLVNQAGLQREEAEEQVAVGIGFHGVGLPRRSETG